MITIICRQPREGHAIPVNQDSPLPTVTASVVVALAFILILSGCAHKKFSESLTETQDDGTPITTKTVDSSWVFWPPFAKTGPVASSLNYTWGGKENKIITGQNTSDVDTTPQAEALKAVTAVLSDVLVKYLQAQATVPAASTLANKITLGDVYTQLQSLGLIKK